MSVKTLRDNDRFAHYREFTVVRREFCIRGRARDIRVQTLAKVLNRNHTTITYHASEKTRDRKLATRTRGPANAQVS